MPIKEWKIFDIDAERCRVAFYRMTMRTKNKRHTAKWIQCVCVCLCAAHAQKWLKTTLTKSGDNWTRQSRSTRTYCQFCAVPHNTPYYTIQAFRGGTDPRRRQSIVWLWIGSKSKRAAYVLAYVIVQTVKQRAAYMAHVHTHTQIYTHKRKFKFEWGERTT